MARKKFSLADEWRNRLEVEDSERPATSSLFTEDLVDLDTFIHDSKYLNKPNLRLGSRQYDLIRHMEQIYFPELYPELIDLFGEYWEPVRFVNRLHVQWGKGAGKDLSVTYAFARIAYLLSCLENPQTYYGIDESFEIHILNVAMNSDQAKRAFFRPMGNLLKKSPWFKGKLTNEITDQGRSIRLLKQLELISGHSQVEGFEGLSPIAVVLDEISGFDSEESKANKGNAESLNSAEAIYDIVRSSAGTRFPESYKVAAISYPRFLHDPIQNLCAEAESDLADHGDKSIYYVSGPLATWDVNPRYDKYERVTIPESTEPVPNVPDIITQFRNNAALARAKLQCKPERSSNRFMRNDSALANAFQNQEDGWEAPIQVHYYWGLDEEGARAEGSYDIAHVPNWQVAYNFHPQFKPMEGAVYGIHVDLGVTSDRAGMAMCHVKNWERRDHLIGDNPSRSDAAYQNEDLPVVKMDFALTYEADMQALTDEGIMQPREIQLRWARNLIRELRRQGFTIGLVTFDTYESRDSIQVLETWGIESDTLSVDRNAKPYVNFKELIYDNRFEGYYDKLLLNELEGLTLLPNGKVDHPPGGSKDMSDAVCGAAINAIGLGGDEGEDPEEVDMYAANDQDYYYHNDPVFGDLDINICQQDLDFNIYS